MYFLLLIPVAIFIFGYIILSLPQFGQYPSGQRLEKIKLMPNYKNGAFQNLSPTPDLTNGATYFSVVMRILFGKKDRFIPTDAIPSTKTDLHTLLPSEDVLVWFGHSSYFMQINGKKFLVDPVFAGYASPFSFTTNAFEGSNIYSPSDMPEIDYLIITHDHWDHLCYTTVKSLMPKVSQVITGLGTGAHLEYWGYKPSSITELNWYESTSLANDFEIHSLPGRHFSGRGFKRNQALWSAFVLNTPGFKIFIGGDSGYDSHFAEIGAKHGPFDIAILENGQSDAAWCHIHLRPEELIPAAKDLKAKNLLAVHNSKFAIANHTWDEPLIQAYATAQKENMPLLTPKIGQVVKLKASNTELNPWWEGLN